MICGDAICAGNKSKFESEIQLEERFQLLSVCKNIQENSEKGFTFQPRKRKSEKKNKTFNAMHCTAMGLKRLC